MKYCGTNCRSKAYRDRQKEKDARQRPAGQAGALAQAARTENMQSTARHSDSETVNVLQREIIRLEQELARERSRYQELMKHLAALTEQNRDLLEAVQRADGRFHWKEFLGGLAIVPFLQTDVAPKIVTQLLESLVNPGARRTERLKQRQDQGTAPRPAKADRGTNSEQAPFTATQSTQEPLPTSASMPPTDRAPGPTASPQELGISSLKAAPEPGLTPLSASEDEASQPREGSQSKGVQPPEQPAREELAIAILTLRRIHGQDVTEEDQAALAAGSIHLLNQELENRLRLLGGHKPDRGDEVPARPSSVQVIASQLLRGSLVVSKLFTDLGKQIPQFTFPAEMGELPTQLDEIYQRAEAVFRSKDERPETRSRLRTLLTDLERWLGLLRPVAKQTVTAIVLYATTYAARDAFRQALKLA